MVSNLSNAKSGGNQVGRVVITAEFLEVPAIGNNPATSAEIFLFPETKRRKKLRSFGPTVAIGATPEPGAVLVSPTAIRLQLKAAGFSPLPLYGKEPPVYKQNNKFGGLSGWQGLHEVSAAQINLWEKTWPDAVNTGALTQRMPAIDIDITYPDAAEAVEALAREWFEDKGRFLVRVGLAPKRAILLRTDAPFKKITTQFIAPSDIEHKIELLGDGQQVVLAGIHPDTGLPYSWHGGAPWEITRADLPEVNEETARAFMAAATKLLFEQFGFRVTAAPTPGKAKANAFEQFGEAQTASDPKASPELVAAALNVLPNIGVPWDEWNAIGMAVWRATGGDGAGFAAFDAWSQKAAGKYDARTTAERWAHFFTSPPNQIGAGSLFYRANEASPGWRGAYDEAAEVAAEEDEEQDKLSEDEAAAGEDELIETKTPTAPALSEEAIALDFATRHNDKLRYVAKWSQWYGWGNGCWHIDETRRVFTLAREICREVANKVNKSSERKRIASAKTRAAIVSLAGEDHRLAATIDQWDTDPWVLNTPDGVVDLRTGNLRPHKIADYTTKQTAVSPRGECPLWNKFMETVTNKDKALEKYLQRVAGYCLTGTTSEQELFFLYGSGNNGKGVWVQTISGLLSDYHEASSIETFTVARSERHPTELAALRGARLVTASETEEGRRWAEARIKEMTGGDTITARFMRQDFFSYKPQFKLLFSGNHMPTLRTVNKAITRRFNRIPFAVTIPDDKVDPHLPDKLKAEWPGILAWTIKGCLDWQRIGLNPPKAVTDATGSYLASEDILGEWLEECCDLGANHWESATTLFKSWKLWAEEREEWVGSVKALSQKIEDRGGFPRCMNPERSMRGFSGLRLNPFHRVKIDNAEAAAEAATATATATASAGAAKGSKKTLF
jgi:putative DNA primase/helicase